jgi:hypothetical protein
MPRQHAASRRFPAEGARDTGGMVVIFKGPGRGPKVRFMPGCLIWSILLSVALTILVNVLIRLL